MFDGDGATVSNTLLGQLQEMVKITANIDVADEKSAHQDYANEQIRAIMQDIYLPIKKLDQFKGSTNSK